MNKEFTAFLKRYFPRTKRKGKIAEKQSKKNPDKKS